MATSIGELIGTISLDDKFSGPANNVAKQLGTFSTSFGAVTGAVGLAAGAITAAAGAIVVLGQRGSAVADVRESFANLTAAAGSSADVMLGALQSGTLGTISNFDLMQMSNATLASGLVRSAEDMETLAAGAKLLADRTGGDTAEAFQTLTSAIASGRTTSLKQMGLFIDSKVAVEDYAKSLNKSVADLTDSERAQALSAAAIAAMKRQLDAAGPATADFGDQIDRGKVAVQNFTDNLAVAVATSPVVAAGLDAVAKGVLAAFGGNQADMVKTLMGFVNEFAIGLTYVAQVAVTGAGVFVTAWFGIKTVVLGVITAVSGAATAIVTLVDGVVDLAMKVPGGAAVVGDLAQGTEQLRLKMEATTLSLAAETAEAARGVTGNSDLHRTLDALGGGVLLARDAMEAARDATAGMTEKAVAAIAPLEAVGAASTAVGLSLIDLLAESAVQFETMLETATRASEIYTEVQNAISLANTTGIAQRQMELEIDKQAQLAKLQELLIGYPEIYAEIATAVNEKFEIMKAASAGYHADIVVQADMAGFRTRGALEATAANALDTYQRMKDSALFTAEEIRKAWEAAEKAKQALTAQTSAFTIGSVGEMLTATAGALQSFGISYKGAAIAGAVLSSISAIQKAWASAPFPANLPAVAIVTTATVANINRIRSSGPGFAEGTGPGGMFTDFGRVSNVNVHGVEAIVTPKQGASIAGMVEEELQARDTRTVDELRGLREDMAADRRRLPIMLRDAALLANA